MSVDIFYKWRYLLDGKMKVYMVKWKNLWKMEVYALEVRGTALFKSKHQRLFQWNETLQ
jgi:hypothetical protein